MCRSSVCLRLAEIPSLPPTAYTPSGPPPAASSTPPGACATPPESSLDHDGVVPTSKISSLLLERQRACLNALSLTMSSASWCRVS